MVPHSSEALTIYYLPRWTVVKVQQEAQLSRTRRKMPLKSCQMLGNKTGMPVIAALPNQVPKSVGTERDFGHFQPSKWHADGCV